MRTSPLAIVLFIIAAFLGALGQFFYKSGAEKTDSTFASYIINARLLAGVVCYIAVMVLFVAAFKRGGALTVLYSIYASTFIFAAIIAWFAYGTPIRAPHFTGFALLISRNVPAGTLMDSNQIGDRRPLASRSWKISERIARWLARRGATPNEISIAGMLCGICAGIMFFETTRVSHPWIFWLGGAILVQLRLLANLYDGMVAVLRQVASPVGELFNEIPDRVSDAATLVGFGYAAGSDPLLGFVATIFAIFLAYLRAQGKVAGAHQEFCGPMAKQQRMAAVTLAAIACAIIPDATKWQVPMFALWLIIAGCIITAVRRLQRISATLRHR